MEYYSTIYRAVRPSRIILDRELPQIGQTEIAHSDRALYDQINHMLNHFKMAARKIAEKINIVCGCLRRKILGNISSFFIKSPLMIRNNEMHQASWTVNASLKQQLISVKREKSTRDASIKCLKTNFPALT